MFGAIAALGGSLIGNFIQNENARDQRRFNLNQNQMAIAHNEAMARQQNNWNIEQWSRENAYNTPLAQRQRFAQAGLNPDLIYGQSNTSASSPTLTSGAPAQPASDASYNNLPNWGNLVMSALQAKQMEAQTKNIEADTKQKESVTKKTDEETKGLSIDNIFKAQHHEQELKIGDTTFKLNLANENLTVKQAEKLKYEMENLAEATENLRKSRETMDAQIALYKQQIESMKKDDKIKLRNQVMQEMRNSVEIKKLTAETELTQKQVDNFLEEFINRQINLRGQNEQLYKQNKLLQNEIVISDAFGYDMAKQQLLDATNNATISYWNAKYTETVRNTETCCVFAGALSTFCDLFGTCLGSVISKM